MPLAAIFLSVSLCLAAGDPSLYQFGRAIPYTRLNSETLLIDNNRFKVANRIIIRTAIDRSTVLAEFPEIGTLTELASIDGETLFLAHLPRSIDPIRYAGKVHSHEGVVHAQPDLLQVVRKHSLNGATAGQNLQIIAPVFESIWRLSKGEGVSIAIIDDGFDLSHPELTETRAGFLYDADLQILDASPKFQPDVHGNRVAGLIFARHDGEGVEGIAPKARFIGIRQVNTWTSNMILAFTVAGLAGADIINCSWSLSFVPQPLAEVIDHAAGSGRWIVAAAGNQGQDASVNALAGLKSVLVIGTAGRNGGAARYSNRGKGVDLYAPSGFLTTGNNGRYVKFSGTSASTAYVSGAMALLLSRKRDMSIEEMEKELRQFAIAPLAAEAR